jgi:serine/threonine protein kinase
VVGKTFQVQYLNQLRSDEVTRRDHATNLSAVSRIAGLSHPGLLPIYCVSPIADNYLFITPRMGVTLLEAISRHKLTPRQRTTLLMQALDALGHLHEVRLLHRDFTLRNILLDDRPRSPTCSTSTWRCPSTTSPAGPTPATTAAGCSARPATRCRPRPSTPAWPSCR